MYSSIFWGIKEKKRSVASYMGLSSQVSITKDPMGNLLQVLCEHKLWDSFPHRGVEGNLDYRAIQWKTAVKGMETVQIKTEICFAYFS